MRFYLDTEFIERGYARIELISIALVTQSGREFYAIASDGWKAFPTDWVWTNVLTCLGDDTPIPRVQIARNVLDFIGNETPEFWGYYADYDWVLLCQLFGTMMDLPKGWPMFCRDVKQLAVDLGNPRLPKQTGGNHNALADARHIKLMHEFLLARK